MKNKIKLIGLIALVAMIGFSMLACPTGGGGGGSGGGSGGGGGGGDGGSGGGSNNIEVNLISVTANGFINLDTYPVIGQTTTQLTLTFDKAIKGLSANDIYISSFLGEDRITVVVTKGTLRGSGPTYTLPITVIPKDPSYNFTSTDFKIQVEKSGYYISFPTEYVRIYYRNSTQYPYPYDYDIDNLVQTAGSVTAVTIKAKPGKSPGAVSNIRYNDSTTIPQTAGTYEVIFDVEPAPGWYGTKDFGAFGFIAGTLTVIQSNPTPVASDYTFGNLTQNAGSVSAVTISPKSGKSPGAITIRYNGSTNIPQTAGTYPVTFDVAAATGWNAATNLSAGNLTVNAPNQTPVAGDYTIGKLNQTAGSVTAVTITANSGKSPGAVSNIRYAGSTAIPQTAGTYAVTFDVAAATGWNAATNLSAGNLTVHAAGDTNQTPVAGDYTIGNLNQTEGSVTAVTITRRSGSTGAVSNIRYAGSTTLPTTPGTYAVTFDVAAVTGWNAATLSAGNLTINARQIPLADHYTFSNMSQTAGSVTAVTITRRSGYSSGAVSNIRYAGSTTIPQTAGTYAVTFDVAAATGWNAATNLSAGNLIVTNQTPVTGDYTFGNLSQTAGSVTAVTITAKSGKSSGAVSNIRYNNSTTIPQTAGTYTVTFDVAAATYWNAATNLSAGTLTVTNQTPVTGDYTIGNLSQIPGSVTAVTITPKSGKSSGARTIYYQGTGGTTYTRSTTIPQTAGTYTVTFDVAAVTYWNAATGLFAGTLTVTNQTPVASDYTIGNLNQTAGSVTAVTITPNSGKSSGARTIKYNGSTTIPQTAGSYAVTFDVAAVTGWNAATNLSAGTLTISRPSIDGMVWINPGTFQMGSPVTEVLRGTNENQHKVTLTSGFYMSIYQVTQEKYQAVMGSNPSSFSSSPAAGETQGKRPVERVSWYSALVFCNKLSILEGLSPAYRISGSTDPAVWGAVPTNINNNATWDAVEIVTGSTGYRLPTEAQWEYACRAGTTTAFNFGESWNENDVWGWLKYNSNSMTHEVGKKLPNAWGLYDMHGNVYEWCWDRYDNGSSVYRAGDLTDPMGATPGGYGADSRMRRGGSWEVLFQSARSAYRAYNSPGSSSKNDTGFRVIRP
jgi:formylglycine-generating enzyme required for sulfatase activity